MLRSKATSPMFTMLSSVTSPQMPILTSTLPLLIFAGIGLAYESLSFTTVKLSSLSPSISAIAWNVIVVRTPGSVIPGVAVLVSPYFSQPIVLLISFLSTIESLPKNGPLSCAVAFSSELLKCSSY